MTDTVARPAQPTRERLATPVFAQLLLTQALFGLGWCMFLVIPKFAVQRFAADPVQVGWVTSVPGIAIVLSIPLVTRHIDRFPARWFMSGGSLLVVLAALGTATVPVLDWRLYVFQALQGLGFVFCFNAGAAMAADLAPPSSLGRAMSWFGASNLSMNGVAPFIGELLLPDYGWRGAYLFAASAAALAMLVALRLPRQTRPERQATDLVARAGTWGFVTWPLARVAISSTLSAFGFMAVMAFYQPFALSEGVVQVRDYFFGFVLMALGVRFGMGGISDWAGSHRVARTAQIAYIIPPLALAWLGPEHLFIVGSLHGLVHGAHFPAMSALAVERVDPHARGRALTLLVGAFNGGTSLASHALGPVAKAWSFEAAFVVGAVIAGLGALTLGKALPPSVSRTPASRSESTAAGDL
ncbi:MAG: MFS transporter [Sandaracinaceae bacterium]|nr:MFS transporter [Sandaracinaceae bacterium]